jgi:peptide chain release factor 1
MLERLKELEDRFQQVNEELTKPEVTSDVNQMAALSKEYKDLEKIISVGREYRGTLAHIQNTKTILETENDEEFLELAKEELEQQQAHYERVEAQLRELLTPKDPEDSHNVIMEIRAGAGGDEACLFAGDLYRMYKRYCEHRGWKMETTDFTEGASGGYKEIVVSISGEDCFGILKFESGVHRVQRVPSTETQGRIHTSAASVAVLPEPEEFEVELKDKDLDIDRFCSSGNGGQSVNTTYSAVRVTHIPTGIVVSMQNERSQIKNLALAKQILKARIFEMEMKKRKEEEDSLRRSMISTGDRSAKIRTYNFPQSRVTDHRIGYTSHNLSGIMDGEMEPVLEALRIAENAEKMATGESASATH